jgi:phage host-nuclease inhibitor protein Gam
MSKKDEFDLDAEVERLARKSNIQMKKTEFSYASQLKKLDKEIDKAINDKIKLFDENKQSTKDYKDIEFKHDTINRYREKLKKI